MSRHMLNTALMYFTGEKYYKAERARTFFKKAQFLEGMDDTGGEAAAAMREAQRLYAEVCTAMGQQCAKEPSLENFDEIVMIMSR
jgi:hypothetical protein